MTNTDKNPFQAEWTAKGHTLCLGHWEISFNQQALIIPEKIAVNDMGTFGNFSYLFQDQFSPLIYTCKERLKHLGGLIIFIGQGSFPKQYKQHFIYLLLMMVILKMS